MNLLQPDDGHAIYRYDWRVQDSLTGQDFGQEEVRQGYSTDGEYQVTILIPESSLISYLIFSCFLIQVVLPDGRKQIVTYRVSDPSSGYVADVRYEGEASFIDQRPSYAAPPPFVPSYTSPIPAPPPAPYAPAAPYQPYDPIQVV